MNQPLHPKKDGKSLPPARQAVLDFCRAEIAAGRGWPSFSAIAAHMGYRNPGSARDVMYKLATYDKVLTREQIGSGEFKWGFVT
jgi:hypothetical protein